MELAPLSAPLNSEISFKDLMKLNRLFEMMQLNQDYKLNSYSVDNLLMV